MGVFRPSIGSRRHRLAVLRRFSRKKSFYAAITAVRRGNDSRLSGGLSAGGHVRDGRGSRSADIRWTSQDPVTLTVRYGKGTEFRETAFDQPALSHDLKLENLEPNTVYDVCIVPTGGDGTAFPEYCDEFRTKSE